MSIEVLSGLDLSRWEQPEPSSDFRQYLEAWLRFQRHEFLRKLRDLTPEGLVAWSVPPVELSVLGLVRHMTQMEHFYLSQGMGGGELVWAYGEEDYAGGSVQTIDEDLRGYFAEVERSDVVIKEIASIDTEGAGHGWPLGAALVKMIDEYALHAGQAHMIRFAGLGKIVR